MSGAASSSTPTSATTRLARDDPDYLVHSPFLVDLLTRVTSNQITKHALPRDFDEGDFHDDVDYDDEDHSM